jgi:hypothetical protein
MTFGQSLLKSAIYKHVVFTLFQNEHFNSISLDN